MSDKSSVKIVHADPTPLGLLGLAIVTFVASAYKFGIVEGLSLVIPWVIFLGASAQLIASLIDYKHNNMFGATAFGAYALFWFSMGMAWMIQLGVFGEAMVNAADVQALGVAFLGYLIFSIYMTIGSVETNKVFMIIFVAIDILLLSLALSAFGIMTGFMGLVSAISELVVSLVGFYGSAAFLLNKHFGYVVLPIGKPLGIFKK